MTHALVTLRGELSEERLLGEFLFDPRFVQGMRMLKYVDRGVAQVTAYRYYADADGSLVIPDRVPSRRSQALLTRQPWAEM